MIMPWPNYTQEERNQISQYLAEETTLYSPPKPKPKEKENKVKTKWGSDEKTKTYSIPVYGGTTGAFGGSAITGIMKIKRKVKEL